MIRLVVGPPAAGKTTYVGERAKEDDLIIDLDALALRVGSREAAKGLRKELEASSGAFAGDVWVIRTLADPDARQSVQRRLGADEVLVIATPEAEALRRAEARGDEPEKLEAIKRWWKEYQPLDTDQVITPDRANDSDKEKTVEVNEFGYPDDTPVAEMSMEHQRNYWKRQSRKHEGRFKDLDIDALQQKATAYDQLAEKVNLDEIDTILERANQDPAEPFDADAFAEQLRVEFMEEITPTLVEARVRAVAKNVPAEFLDRYLEDVDYSRFIGEDGLIDTDLIDSRVADLPTTGDLTSEGPKTDFHQGVRDYSGSGTTTSGAELYARTHSKEN